MRALGLGVFIVLLVSSVASADIDIAKSDAAFEEGLKLKDAGQLDKACIKFKEALQYNPNAVGTMLNVAVCDEQTNQIASAYRLFKDARDHGREQNLTEQVKLAEQHLAKLEPDMPYIAVAFAEVTDDTKLLVNNEVVAIKDAGNWPVDPGPVSIVASRPGHVPYETRTTIEKKEHKAIAVPKLGLPVADPHARRKVGMAFTFVGGAAAIAGVVVGLYAKSKYEGQFSGSTPNCDKVTLTCNDEGFQKTSSAATYGNVGTGVGLGGVALLAVGAYLWFFSPKDEKPPPAVTIAPHFDGQGFGLTAVGHF
jgi:hypothetical protein